MIVDSATGGRGMVTNSSTGSRRMVTNTPTTRRRMVTDSPTRGRRRPRLPILNSPFGEENLRTTAEFLRRCVSVAGPAPWVGAATAGAAVGGGAAARAAADGRCA
jgi:hypothetical protein